MPAALAVQNQLSQVQLDLEQARGRLQYLDNRVAFATISMSMHELGVVAPKDGGFKIVDAWATAGSAFLTVVGWLFIGIAVAAPVLILLSSRLPRRPRDQEASRTRLAAAQVRQGPFETERRI